MEYHAFTSFFFDKINTTRKDPNFLYEYRVDEICPFRKLLLSSSNYEVFWIFFFWNPKAAEIKCKVNYRREIKI